MASPEAGSQGNFEELKVGTGIEAQFGKEGPREIVVGLRAVQRVEHRVHSVDGQARASSKPTPLEWIDLSPERPRLLGSRVAEAPLKRGPDKAAPKTPAGAIPRIEGPGPLGNPPLVEVRHDL